MVAQKATIYSNNIYTYYWTLNIIVILKCGSDVTQGHWKWYHLKVWVRFLNFSYTNPNPNPKVKVTENGAVR